MGWVIIPPMSYRLQRLPEWALLAFTCALLLAASAPATTDAADRARAFTRQIEFDYGSWTLNAAWVKLEQSALGSPYYFRATARKQIVTEYLRLSGEVLRAEAQLSLIYGDPNIADAEAASADVRQELKGLHERQGELAPLAESVLQEQIGAALAELGLSEGGQPLPPVLYHATPLPLSLIVSPRAVIQQEANVSLLPGLTADQQAALEGRIDEALNVSALVVPVGGVGSYPSMVARTTDLPWLIEVIAHEWTHNFLTLRPLGLNYETSPQLRIMNETAAAIAGKEIGALVLQRDYPELATRQRPDLQVTTLPLYKPNPGDIPRPVFDFRAEMHETRVTADKLLAEGRIAEAEAYMEERRKVFWDNGYPIRKLNQAYFAFYGAYADIPGGAAGEDPIGAAVRALRGQSEALSTFLRRIAWMTSFDELQKAASE